MEFAYEFLFIKKKSKMSNNSNHPRRQTFADAFANVFVPANMNEDLIQNENPDNPVEIPVPNPVEILNTVNTPPNEENFDDSSELTEEPVDTSAVGEVTIADLRDGIVSENTLISYLGDIVQLLSWCLKNEGTWLTAYGKRHLNDALNIRPDEGVRAHHNRRTSKLKFLLRNSFEKHIIFVDVITAVRYMDFILSLTGRNGSRYLGTSAYGSKRSALHHLFRLHNRMGFKENFKNELHNLYRGLFRNVTQLRQQHVPNEQGGGRVVENNKSSEGGKEAMSVELYKALCFWFLEYGTVDGVFAYCYLCLTWNLSCRAANTANIRFKDISWSSSFDSFAVVFSHSKTDQLGDESKFLRRVYSNTTVPVVCPVLSLGVYLSSCFNTLQSADCYFFPGQDQSKRFGKILGIILKLKVNAVKELGYKIVDLGTHSIRKGAVSYLSSLPGGPPSAAVCIRAGWTMGKVKDIYMRYVVSGDQFVGRCLCLLPILSSDFGCSPPYFVLDNNVNGKWIDDMRVAQFPMVHMVEGLGRLTKMCLASILYHRHWLLSLLHDGNHVIIVTSNVLRNGELLNKINNNKELIQVTYPWTDQNAFSGIPPHISLMNQVTQMKDKQELLVSEFIGEMRHTLETMGVDGGRMSENNLKNILQNFEEKFINRIGVVPLAAVTQNEVDSIRNENGKTYTIHYYLNSYRRVPIDWRFPRCGVADLWRHWWIGDSVRQRPPLRS